MNSYTLDLRDDVLKVEMRGQQYTLPLWETVLEIMYNSSQKSQDGQVSDADVASKIRQHLKKHNFPEDLSEVEIFLFITRLNALVDEIRKKQPWSVN